MTRYFECPHCGEVHKNYVPSGRSRTPRCMKCHKLVPKNLVPEKYIRNSPAKWFRLFKKKGKKQVSKEGTERKVKSRSSKKKGKKELTKEGTKREAEEEEKERESLFISSRSSHEILEEVLREFNCNEAFIKAMMRRSRRINGIYPGDLRNYISRMNSGIKSREQAAFIADEYRLALDEEKEKTPEGGYETAYPVEKRSGYERYKSPSRARKKDYYAGHPEERYVGAYKEPRRAGRERGERVSRRDVREMVEDTLDRMEQKREREEILRNLGDRITRIESDMGNIPHQINEGMSKVLEKRQAESPEKITKKDINNVALNLEKRYMERALNLEKKYMERDFKRSTEESKERDKEYQKIVEDLSKERNELLKKLADRRSTETAGYQSDSGRVIGEAVSGLKDVIETRQPVKVVFEGLPKLLYPGTGGLEKRRTPELKEEKPKMIGGGVSRYLDKEYVEETETSN